MTDDDDATIVRAIIQLGKSLGMQVIAEGVETNEQEAYIIKEGCHEGQGYLYSKPLSARALSAYLIQGERQRTRILKIHISGFWSEIGQQIVNKKYFQQ